MLFSHGAEHIWVVPGCQRLVEVWEPVTDMLIRCGAACVLIISCCRRRKASELCDQGNHQSFIRLSHQQHGLHSSGLDVFMCESGCGVGEAKVGSRLLTRPLLTERTVCSVVY
ncbi:hypothetical protein GOODEAATRI_016238 [Goodea atripinnis]|uniref:Uncharacterized protein n=1 Tax=Goodea atripinnis TaxID=208336 RepID=A0ABV0P4R0_9TELE